MIWKILGLNDYLNNLKLSHLKFYNYLIFLELIIEFSLLLLLIIIVFNKKIEIWEKICILFGFIKKIFSKVFFFIN